MLGIGWGGWLFIYMYTCIYVYPDLSEMGVGYGLMGSASFHMYAFMHV